MQGCILQSHGQSRKEQEGSCRTELGAQRPGPKSGFSSKLFCPSFFPSVPLILPSIPMCQPPNLMFTKYVHAHTHTHSNIACLVLTICLCYVLYMISKCHNFVTQTLSFPFYLLIQIKFTYHKIHPVKPIQFSGFQHINKVVQS